MTAWTSKDYVLSFFFFFCCVFCFVFNYIKYKLRILFKKKKNLDFFKNLIVLYYALCAGQSCCPIIPRRFINVIKNSLIIFKSNHLHFVAKLHLFFVFYIIYYIIFYIIAYLLE